MFPGGSEGQESACNAGVPGSIPGSEVSSGEGNGNQLQYFCLKNSMDRGACSPWGPKRVRHNLAINTLTVAGYYYVSSLTALCLGLFAWNSGSQLGPFCPPADHMAMTGDSFLVGTSGGRVVVLLTSSG